MNRTITPILLILISVSAVHFYLRRHARARADANVDAAQAALDRRLSEVRFVDARLEDAFRQLASMSGLTFRIDWKSLSGDSVTPETRVAVLTTNLRLGWALQQVLIAASPRAEVFWPGFEVCDDGTLRIARTHDLLANVETRRYDIRDLARVPVNSKGEVYGHEIHRHIADSVAARTWAPQPDAFGEIRYDGGWLVVTHTSAGLHATERALEQFRRDFGAQSARILNAEYTTPWE